jgi:hypothetical protein
MEVLACRKERFGSYENGLIWGAVLLCVMWLLWHKWNNRVFNGMELNGNLCKAMFLRFLADLCFRKFSGSFILDFITLFEVLIVTAFEEIMYTPLFIALILIKTFLPKNF